MDISIENFEFCGFRGCHNSTKFNSWGAVYKPGEPTVYSGTRIDYKCSANGKPRSIQSRIPNLALGAWPDPISSHRALSLAAQETNWEAATGEIL